MRGVLVDFENNWPQINFVGHTFAPPDYNTLVIDGCHNLGVNLVIAGALATAADAAIRAGIDLGIALVAKEMQDDAMRQAAKGKAESILVPSRQLILPGSEGWKP